MNGDSQQCQPNDLSNGHHNGGLSNGHHNGDHSEVHLNGDTTSINSSIEKNQDTYQTNVIVLQPNDQLKELHTILRDKETSRGDFIFYADRLIRLVVEEGLNQLPCEPMNVITPTGQTYNGVCFTKGNCGVSIIRSGEAMERGLRDCCRSIRIGKILIASPDTGGAGGDQVPYSIEPESSYDRVVYAKLPSHIHKRNVLLMYPILYTGNKIIKAIEVLKTYGVKESSVILLSLFATPPSVKTIMSKFPNITLLTSEIHQNVPVHFGQRYFGTQDQL